MGNGIRIVRTEGKGRERCLNVGEGRKKEDLKINLRIVYFRLAEIRSGGRGTDFKGDKFSGEIPNLKSLWDIHEVPSNRTELEEKGLGWRVRRVM